MAKNLEKYAMTPDNPKWEDAIARLRPLYVRQNETRTPFFRDYTRIIHSSAFRRLKHKTQVFFSPQSDHICTRIEHVLHVESIATAIADSLGLNAELVRSIAVGHDLGHSPFGHKGEKVIDAISRDKVGESFWHEKNSLFFVDSIELLEDADRNRQNLDLTYAVRDGLICHCGESGKNHLFPRDEAKDLTTFVVPGAEDPFTYEGCVVRMADRISYVGRDVEDAAALGILSPVKLQELTDLVGRFTGNKINNTIIINYLIRDLCLSSTPETGVCFSDATNEFFALLQKFNYENIYRIPRVTRADAYFELVIRTIFDLLYGAFDGEKTPDRLEELAAIYPGLGSAFLAWLSCYWTGPRKPNLLNPPVFCVSDGRDYARAILCYVAGMSDRYAMDSYNEIISF
ncbi:MAG: HD domain-containing protein [Clostridia bacterium]|nr:HD domain-containing protein [Clostridia bacterium]